MPELEEIKVRQGKKLEEARASTTDDQATVMKMADGSYRPAYNAQFATDTDSQVIVGVEVVTTGSDMAQLEPMVDQVTERYGQPAGGWRFSRPRTTRRGRGKHDSLCPGAETRGSRDGPSRSQTQGQPSGRGLAATHGYGRG